MAGSPLKRARKAGVTDPVTGELIPFPYMPRVAELPKGWKHFSLAAKIEHLLGMRLDRVARILAWPVTELDPLRLSLWFQVWHITWKIGMKALLDGSLAREVERERNRERILGELERALCRNSSAGT